MGYTTKFSGTLKFTAPITALELVKLNGILGEDCRDHAEWGRHRITYIDLELTKEIDGLKFNGSEKSYFMDEQINLVINLMKTTFQHFGLEGALLAQGEEIGDVYKIVMENNIAVVHEIKL